MTTYEPMAFRLETGRLSMRLWAESDAGELAALMSERGRGTPAVGHARDIIVKALAKTAADGLALLPIRR
jgi:hypothetical protein